MTFTGSAAEALAWQIEIGADEAIGEVAGLMNWQRREAASAKPSVAPLRSVASGFGVRDSAAPAAIKKTPPQPTVFTPSAPITATSLTELRAELERFEGCELKKTAMNMVFADGNPQADIMIVGDVPAEDEDRQGLPFVGASGQLLDKMLASIGLDRTAVYLTNLVFWRPPGNRTPSEAEIAACLPFTRQHIALVKPKLLVVMGATTAKNLLHSKETFVKMRGRWCDYVPVSGSTSLEPIRCLPTFHPSYLLRQPALKRQSWADLLCLMKEINELSH